MAINLLWYLYRNPNPCLCEANLSSDWASKLHFTSEIHLTVLVIVIFLSFGLNHTFKGGWVELGMGCAEFGIVPTNFLELWSKKSRNYWHSSMKSTKTLTKPGAWNRSTEKQIISRTVPGGFRHYRISAWKSPTFKRFNHWMFLFYKYNIINSNKQKQELLCARLHPSLTLCQLMQMMILT